MNTQQLKDEKLFQKIFEQNYNVAAAMDIAISHLQLTLFLFQYPAAIVGLS